MTIDLPPPPPPPPPPAQLAPVPVPPTLPPPPFSEAYTGQEAYCPPGTRDFLPLTARSFQVFRPLDEIDEASIRGNAERLSEMFSTALQIPNLGFFAGSGTSLGDVGGPSMWRLWQLAMCDGNGDKVSETAAETIASVRYSWIDTPNIEHFLSQCDAYLGFNDDAIVNAFVNRVKGVILEACSQFVDNPHSDLSAYRTLLQKLARRRVRDPRLKVFTTNYDTCFETAASELGMVTIDGFSHTRRRRFDGRHFSYDIVRRDTDSHEFAEGVYQLLKLHGSVSWSRLGTEIYETATPSAESACLIYPAKGKYQQAFLQPHLEILSRFLEFMRQPNSCLVVAGFGFSDDHLSEPIYSAARSNPSMRVVIADPKCVAHINNGGRYGSSIYWRKFYELALEGQDIHFINGSFSTLVDHIPYLRAATPAEQLANAVKRVGRNG